MPKTTTQLGKDLYNAITATGLDTYGANINTSWVHNIVGISVPLTGTRKQFQTLALRELSIVDYVRNKFLDRGMYLKGTDTGYRVLLPSENAGQIELYRKSAARKLNRARKLAKSSPPATFQGNINPLPAIMAARKGLRKKPVKNVVAPASPPIPPVPSAPPTTP